ncbi:uncharacterized protein LOC134528075 isoform X3 [Bacillus rossius redtenbacheri]|uniref:uncharacterized protein LOC134528075 isoform X3 n=1 Tax=Bacillus rossius redtenbacheri TaxID=93214 RepID=UPI002FDCF4C9
MKYGERQNPMLNIQSSLKSQFMCGICNIVTSCQEHLENHIKGHKHKKVAQRLKEAKYLEMHSAYDDEEEYHYAQEYDIIESQLDVSKKKLDSYSGDDTEYTDVLDLFCKLCNLQLTSKKEVMQHLRSREHLEEVDLRKKQVLLSIDDPEIHQVEVEHKCDLCLLKFPSKSMYNAHLQWKQHVKKLASKMQSENKHRCELCKMDFFSMQMYKAHLTTKRHIGNEKWLKESQIEAGQGKSVDARVIKNDTAGVAEVKDGRYKNIRNERSVKSEHQLKSIGVNDLQEKSFRTDGNVEDSSEKTKNNNLEKKMEVKGANDKTSGEKTHGSTNSDEKTHGSTNSDEKTHGSTNSDEKTHRSMTSVEKTCGGTTTDKTHGGMPTDDKTFDDTPTDDKTFDDTPTDDNSSDESDCFDCEVCGISFAGCLPFEQHLMSMKHILQVSIKQSTSQQNTSDKTNSVSAASKTSKSLFCKFCLVTSLTKYQHELHLNSKKHKDALIMLEVIKYEPKVKMPLNPKPVTSLSQGVKASAERKQDSFKMLWSTSSKERFSSRSQSPFLQRPGVSSSSRGSRDTVRQSVSQTKPRAFSYEGWQTSDAPRATLASVITRTPDVYRAEARPPPIRRSTYSCKVCSASFISGVDYKDHIKICKKKENSKETKYALNKSSKPILQTDPYFCVACDVEFTSYHTFIEHNASAEHEANIEHLLEYGEMLKSERKEKIFLRSESLDCKKCNVSFFSELLFNRHMNSTDHLRKQVMSSTSFDHNSRSEREQKTSRKLRSRSRGKKKCKADAYDKDSSCLKSRKTSSDSNSDGLDLMPRKRIREEYECTVCNKAYSSKRKYRDHLSSKKHKKKMCLYECSDCCRVFSSRYDFSNHKCDLDAEDTCGAKGGDRDRWLQNWGSQDQSQLSEADRRSTGEFSYEEDNSFLDVDEDFEISKNLLLPEKPSKESLLSTFSFKKEIHNIMVECLATADLHG